MNATAPILRYGRTRPDAAALIEGEHALSYRELARLVSQTAAHLDGLGVRPRDRIGICLKDTGQHVVALLAVARLGAVAVPLDWRARPAENIRLLAAAGSRLTLVEPAAPELAVCPCIAVDAAWRDAVARAEPAAEAAIGWHDPFVISASSGSTGAAKLTLMTHLQYHFAIAGMFEILGLAGQHRYLSTLPLYYSGGRNSCMAHLLRGDCVILYPSLFSAGEYVEAARRHSATVGLVVPSMLRTLLAESDGDAPLLPWFSALFCAGAPLSATEKRDALRCLTPRFHERFGAAECLAIAVLRPEDVRARADSVGQPHSLADVEVVDDDGRPPALGRAGRLRVRGPGLASPLPGAEASFRDGWFYPGEIARLDERGFIFIEGRTTEIIMRRGAKVHPAEIEEVLREHPDITEAAVIGWPAGNDDGEIVAFVAARREMPLGDLVAHCRVRLTPHKVPRRFHFMGRLPKNAAGKIDKPALAETLTRSAQS